MSGVSFGNLSTNNIQNSPELQKRTESQENFGAIDAEKLKQDTVEIKNKAKENAKENFVFRTLRNFGVDDPKKFLISSGLTLATIVSFAALGKNTLNKMTNLGFDLDKVLTKEGSLYNKIGGFFSGVKGKIGGFFKKNNTIREVCDILGDKAKRAKPKFQMAKGMGQGFSPQFAYAVKDMVEASSTKIQGDTFKELKKIMGKGNAINLLNEIAQDESAGFEKLKKIIGDENEAYRLFASIKGNNARLKNFLQNLLGDKADDFYGNFVGFKQTDDASDLVDRLTKAISENFKIDMDDKESLLKLFNGIKAGEFDGKDLSLFKDITMDREGFIGSWLPANIIDSLGKKVFKDKWKPFGKGNLGEALLRYNVSKGNMAKTTLGKLAQNSLLIPGESISNFVCDNATMNFFLVGSIIGLFNNMQDAPKGQKAGVIADDFVGTIGQMALATPLAFKTTYGLASLSKLEGNGLLKTPLKLIGKVFNMGLKENSNILARFGGGALRFASIMFLFSPLFQKPISALIHKVFGKPYDKEAAMQAAQLEEQKKQVIPELGITQGELMDKIEKNPKAIEKLQSDPQLIKAMEANPKLILDLLDGKEINPNVANKTSSAANGQILSPANTRLISNRTNMAPSSLNASTKAPAPSAPKETITNVDSATYIPASTFSAKTTTMSAEQQSKYDALMARSDKLISEAEKYI